MLTRARVWARAHLAIILGAALVGAFALLAAPAAGGIHLAAMMTDPPTITFPTVDLTSVGANVTAFFGFLAPVLWLVGGIAIGGLLLHKARGMF